jgi:8-amino-7-oxononanoate synthase
MAKMAGSLGVRPDDGPWFRSLDRLQNEARSRGGELVSFANYDYLGLADHPEIRAAAHAMLDEAGVGALGSRLVGGERSLHAAFEEKIAAFIGAESCLTLVSGYLTNLSTVSSIMGRHDLVVYDELSHNSIVAGARACRNDSRMFRHNDMDDLRAVLAEVRGEYHNCLIVAESLYSMDGDIVDLPELLAVKDEFGCWLMLDEAHSIGVLGRTGRGISEHFGIDPRRIDIIIGTLSKTFATCGGFICAERSVLDFLRYTLPGFVYSVGMSPVIVAAAEAALDVLDREPERVGRLRDNGRRFLARAADAGLVTGQATGDAIVPVIFPDLATTIGASAHLLERGIYAPPIVSVGVPKDSPRIRFFISARHTFEEIDRTVDELRRFLTDRVGLAAGSGALAAQESAFS